MPVRNLTIYDILAITIPGSLLLILFFPVFVLVENLSGFFGDFRFPSLGDTTVSITFLIVSYIFGSLIQGVAERSVFRVGSHRPRLKRLTAPGRFESFYDKHFISTQLYNSTEFNKPFNAQVVRRYEDGNGRALLERSEELFQMDLFVDDNDGRRVNERKLTRLYWLIQSYLFTRQIDRAQRWSLLEKFHRGAWVAFLLSAFTNGIGFVVSQIIGSFLLGYPESVLVNGTFAAAVLFSLVGSVVAHQERRKYARYWGSALLDDFFTNAVIEGERSRPLEK